MPLYTAQVQFDTVVVSPAPPANTVLVNPIGGFPNYFAGGFILMAKDTAGNFFGLGGSVTGHNWNGGNATEFVASYGAVFRASLPILGQTLDPYTWQLFDESVTPSHITETDGHNGAGYLGGGTLSITKDFANDQLIFNTPLGTITRSLSEMDPFLVNSANFDGPIWPVGHGHTITQQDTLPPETESASLFNFYQLIDTARFFGFALSAADPGSFDAYVSVAEDSSGGSVVPFPDSNSQATNRFIQRYLTTAGQYGGIRDQHQWRYISLGPPADYASDMDKAKDHGVVWSTFVDTNDATAVITNRTFDNGRHWERHDVFRDAATSNEFPTINWFNTRLYVTWSQDANNILQAVSFDGGENWNMPLTLPFTGTHPRHIIDKNGGVGLYFFFDGADLKVARSYDLGATFVDTLPRIVVLGVGAQTIDAEFGPDGSIMVTLFVSGIWTKYRSTDLGNSWS